MSSKEIPEDVNRSNITMNRRRSRLLHTIELESPTEVKPPKEVQIGVSMKRLPRNSTIITANRRKKLDAVRQEYKAKAIEILDTSASFNKPQSSGINHRKNLVRRSILFINAKKIRWRDTLEIVPIQALAGRPDDHIRMPNDTRQNDGDKIKKYKLADKKVIKRIRPSLISASSDKDRTSTSKISNVDQEAIAAKPILKKTLKPNSDIAAREFISSPVEAVLKEDNLKKTENNISKGKNSKKEKSKCMSKNNIKDFFMPMKRLDDESQSNSNNNNVEVDIVPVATVNKTKVSNSAVSGKKAESNKHSMPQTRILTRALKRQLENKSKVSKTKKNSNAEAEQARYAKASTSSNMLDSYQSPPLKPQKCSPSTSPIIDRTNYPSIFTKNEKDNENRTSECSEGAKPAICEETYFAHKTGPPKNCNLLVTYDDTPRTSAEMPTFSIFDHSKRSMNPKRSINIDKRRSMIPSKRRNCDTIALVDFSDESENSDQYYSTHPLFAELEEASEPRRKKGLEFSNRETLRTITNSEPHLLNSWKTKSQLNKEESEHNLNMYLQFPISNIEAALKDMDMETDRTSCCTSRHLYEQFIELEENDVFLSLDNEAQIDWNVYSRPNKLAHVAVDNATLKEVVDWFKYWPVGRPLRKLYTLSTCQLPTSKFEESDEEELICNSKRKKHSLINSPKIRKRSAKASFDPDYASDESTDNSIPNPLVLIGPHGIGKSQIINAISMSIGRLMNDNQANVLTYGSDQRKTKALIDQLIRGATSSHRLNVEKMTSGQATISFTPMYKTQSNVIERKRTIILFKDVDSIFDDEEAFAQALPTLIAQSSVPIVLTANKMPDDCFLSLLNKPVIVHVKPDQAKQIAVVQATTLALSQRYLQRNVVEQVLAAHSYNLRKVLTLLSLYFAQKVDRNRAITQLHPINAKPFIDQEFVKDQAFCTLKVLRRLSLENIFITQMRNQRVNVSSCVATEQSILQNEFSITYLDSLRDGKERTRDLHCSMTESQPLINTNSFYSNLKSFNEAKQVVKLRQSNLELAQTSSVYSFASDKLPVIMKINSIYQSILNSIQVSTRCRSRRSRSHFNNNFHEELVKNYFHDQEFITYFTAHQLLTNDEIDNRSELRNEDVLNRPTAFSNANDIFTTDL